jgi:CubicO group peptidase (beta-lactamase class C family)/lysophospholipase L1-like esterase
MGERARRLIARVAGCLALAVPAVLAGASPVPSAAVDPSFSAWTSVTPGCAVGVAEGGRILLERAYGMADLEHGVPNRPDTIFEAGSVAKQFTAAAVLLLAEDGKLSLDDPLRRHFPELPEYASSITVRQMLQHTSGLRDWGSVAGIGGWPRGTRVHAHEHVLEILARQQSLNFAPGSRWSYSNSGYNLAAMLVARVAGESFADFSRKRLFEPLGMTRTSWRDDFTRLVEDRAVAYAKADDRYVLDMPFENVHGNGGLLTTVGDLLRWNANFESPKVGGPDFGRVLQAPGRLTRGEETGYGLGLGVGRYKGVQEIRHSGTTGSYRAFLARYPEQRVSVAVLCNAGDSAPRRALHAVADLYLADTLQPDPAPKPVKLSAAERDALAGLYRNIDRGDTVRIERDGDGLRLDGATPLVALSPLRLTDGEGTTLEFDGAGGVLMDEGSGAPVVLERVPPAQPAVAELEALTGRFSSDEAETTITARVRDGALELVQRPATVYRLEPLYADAFDSELGTVIFRRDSTGALTALSVVQDRVWDLRFRREGGAAVRRVLVFGDSNTWGWIPVERGIPTTRYAADQRWPGVLQAALGDGFEIIEEGLSGRTTDLFDSDPTVKELSGAGLDGSAYLPAAVASHLPLDLVVIMLGTNDLKTKFDRSPEAIALGLRGLVERVRRIDRGAWTEYPAPRVLVLAPPPLVQTDRFPAAILAGGIEKSRALASHLEAVAAATGAGFLDVGSITSADGVDGIHLSEAAHRKVGLAVAHKIRAMLE